MTTCQWSFTSHNKQQLWGQADGGEVLWAWDGLGWGRPRETSAPSCPFHREPENCSEIRLFLEVFMKQKERLDTARGGSLKRSFIHNI